MTLALYMDHHVPRPVTRALRLRDVDVMTAGEDGASEFDDPILLERAGYFGRVLFTQDRDLLKEAARRQRNGIPFNGVIYAPQARVSISTCIHDLEIIAKVSEPEDLMNGVRYLPL